MGEETLKKQNPNFKKWRADEVWDGILCLELVLEFYFWNSQILLPGRKIPDAVGKHSMQKGQKNFNLNGKTDSSTRFGVEFNFYVQSWILFLHKSRKGRKLPDANGRYAGWRVPKKSNPNSKMDRALQFSMEFYA